MGDGDLDLLRSGTFEAFELWIRVVERMEGPRIGGVPEVDLTGLALPEWQEV